MTSETQVELVKRYFDAVDAENLSGLLDTLAPSCIFTVETHDVQLEGHAETSEMRARSMSRSQFSQTEACRR